MMQCDRTLARACWMGALLVGSLLLPARSQIQLQVGPGGGATTPPNVRGGTLFTPSRERTRKLRQAKELIRAENYKDALTQLQILIDKQSDSFYFEDIEKKDKFLSHKAEAMRLIETLPAKGREAYELRFGIPAKQQLRDALQTGDYNGIEEVARRYFHTEAGYRATYLLATQELDRGNPLTAALHFERLRRISRREVRERFEPMLSLQLAVCWGRAGMPEHSMKTLLELKHYVGGEKILVGGKRYALFDADNEAMKWLAKTLGEQEGFAGIGQEQWVMFRGNSSRTARSAPASPVWDAHWSLDTIRDPDIWPASGKDKLDEVAKEVESFSVRRRKEGLLMQPAFHPLIVGDLAVFRTLRNLWAVNIRTGQLEWKSVVEDEDFKVLAGLSKDRPDDKPKTRNGLRRVSTNVNLSQLQMFLDQRLWRDMTAGTLSSDGKYVFAVEKLDYHNRGARYVNRFGQVQQTGLNASNQLMAFDARSGKLAWHIGGKEGDGEDQKPLRLAGHFFLGPPLPLGEQLFCLADYRGEIRLLALEVRKERGADGKMHPKPRLLWKQTLVFPNEGVTKFPLRRMAGLTPSYSGGVLVCPTTSGAVVAVDPARRLLLWGYVYPMNTGTNSRTSRFTTRSRGLPSNPYDAESRWLDAGVTIADNRAILTPRDSNELHCVNLVDGNLIWKRTRGSDLYVAAVFDGNLITVGANRINAIRISDGEQSWKQPTPLPAPSGRGFQTGRFYHIPLQTAEVATIDLKSGRILARTKTRSGTVPGNLVSADGLIVSQSVGRMMGFKPFDAIQQEIAAKLKTKANDAEALALRGEIRLRGGDEPGGLADLRKSIAVKPADRAKSLVASNLLEGLRLNFAEFRKFRPELENLLTTDAQRARYHHLLAAGLHEVGEHREAFLQYLKLAGPNTGRWKLQKLGGGLRVRGDRWLRSRIADVFAKSSKTEQRQLVTELQRQLDVAAKETGPVALRRFVNAFGRLPTTQNARLELTKRLNDDNNALELEFLLQALRTSPDLETAGYATARMARLFATQGHFDAAADLLAELEAKFGGVLCLDGKTGKEFAADLRRGLPQLTEADSARHSWPRRRIVANSTDSPSRNYVRSYPFDFEGERGPYFEDWSFALSYSSKSLEARDGRGMLRWSVSVRNGRSSSFNYYGNSMRVHGHLVVLTLGNRFKVIDGLSRNAKVLWERDLYEVPFGQPTNRNVRVRRVIRVAGRMRWVISDPYGNPLGNVGPISADAVVYQAGRTLYAAHPISGEILWKREAVERGSRLFGDDDYVFVVAPGATTATVLRTTDGALVGSRPVADKAARKTVRGRFELTWRRSGEKYLLSYVDVFQKQIVWQKQYSDDAKVEIVHGDEVAVVEPKKGHFHVLSLEDGKTRLESPIEPDPGLDHFMVRRSKERYVLISYSPGLGNKNNVLRVNGVNYSPLVHGYVYGFDRESGKRVWTTFVRHQSVDLDQPTGMPVLIFSARRYFNRNAGGIRRSSYKHAVTILDTRNGRMILDYEKKGSVYPYQLKVDPIARKIEVKFYRTIVHLAMTDKPLGAPNTRVAPRNQPDADEKNTQNKKKAQAPAQPKRPQLNNAQRAVAPNVPK